MNVATTANFSTQLSVCLFLQKLRRPEPEGFTLSCVGVNPYLSRWRRSARTMKGIPSRPGKNQ
jgi:hypothetical protein